MRDAISGNMQQLAELGNLSTDDYTLGYEYLAKGPRYARARPRPALAEFAYGRPMPVARSARVLSIRIDNGPLLASRVRVISTFWQRHWPFDRQHLSADQGLLMTPGRSVHSIGMPCAIDVVFLDDSWRALELLRELPPKRWAHAPRLTRAVLLLAAGRCDEAGLHPGMTLHQDSSAMRTALPFATTLLRRGAGSAKSEPRAHREPDPR